jgi:two-component system CheB/CheR fusion protein
MNTIAGPMVVALGASAGGIQAFRSFFEHVPPDSGLAFVVILHLSPDYESHLNEVLQTTTPIPVDVVTGRVQLQRNHVYVVSPQQSLSLDNGDIIATAMQREDQRRAPIDMFFRCLAETRGPNAACVVMSGTGTDGAMGLKRVKERGGICLAQSPDTAEYADMPRHAIATDLVDDVLPPEEMPARIVAYRDRIGHVQATSAPAPPGASERGLHDLFTQLRLRTGHDFSNYKRATILRRIDRRLGVRQLPDVDAYATFVREHPEELEALLKDLLISVTNFFRDAPAFAAIEQIVPRLFEHKGEDDQVRVWVGGCATGEEAYSLGMLLMEHASAAPGGPAIQIFATDIDAQAIATAREGLYTAQETADVSQERLRRFFSKEGDRFRVRKELRELVLFAQHNLIKDPPFSHLDLVSCRNLLIYLNRMAQQRVLEVLHFALRPGSYLFLGGSESVQGTTDLFAAVDKDANIFRSRAVVPKIVPALGPSIAPVRPLPPSVDRGGETLRARVSMADLHQRLLEAYAPPSLVVNEAHEIVHLSPRAGQYMHFVGGEPSHSLFKAVRPELRLELRAALAQAAAQRTSVESRGLTLRLNDRTVQVNLLVRPVLRENDPASGFFLVLFEESPIEVSAEAAGVVPSLSDADPTRALEEELARIRDQLRFTIEQHETQAEELKASNEELQAINEELRSATEELETSREELQSVNEELRTVNQELKVKIDEQAQSANDVQNLINSTDIGTVFLDRAGLVKLFTPRAADVFHLLPSDRGRPLADIRSRLVDVDPLADIERVRDRFERVEREVSTADGRWHLMRVGPYRTADGHIDGVVLTFVDITERKLGAERVRRSEERLRRALAIDTVGVAFFRDDGVITDANEAFFRMSGHVGIDLSAWQLRIGDLTAPESVPDLQRAFSEFAHVGRSAPYQREHVRPDGSRWWALVTSTRLGDNDGVEFVVDISERMAAEDALREADRRKNHFLATLAHELRNPLAPIGTALQLLRMTGGEGPTAEKARATIERQVSQMVRLVEDLLEVSRITLGKIELRRQHVALVDAIRAAAETSAPLMKAAGHSLTTEVVDDALTVDADPVRLAQVFANLLNNAAKYTPAGGHIFVRCFREGPHGVVSVKDDGSGITPTVLPYIFDVFTQGDQTPGTATGLGIGLALVRSLVDAHGGQVEVTSEGPGRGAEFRVRLPLVAEPADATGASKALATVDLVHRRVLVVDDNRDAAESLSMLLTMLGGDVRVAYSGEQGLAVAAEHQPVLAFLDIGMPGMNGYEVAAKLRETSSSGRLTLVAVTGWGQPKDRALAARAGFDHHLTKPADVDQLRTLLEQEVARETLE